MLNCIKSGPTKGGYLSTTARRGTLPGVNERFAPGRVGEEKKVEFKSAIAGGNMAAPCFTSSFARELSIGVPGAARSTAAPDLF